MTIFFSLLLILVLLACWSLTLLGLPGNWLMVMVTTTYVCFVPAQSPAAIGWRTVVTILVLAALGEIVELVASAMGVSKQGRQPAKCRDGPAGLHRRRHARGLHRRARPAGRIGRRRRVLCRGWSDGGRDPRRDFGGAEAGQELAGRQGGTLRALGGQFGQAAAGGGDDRGRGGGHAAVTRLSHGQRRRRHRRPMRWDDSGRPSGAMLSSWRPCPCAKPPTKPYFLEDMPPRRPSGPGTGVTSKTTPAVLNLLRPRTAFSGPPRAHRDDLPVQGGVRPDNPLATDFASLPMFYMLTASKRLLLYGLLPNKCSRPTTAPSTASFAFRPGRNCGLSRI